MKTKVVFLIIGLIIGWVTVPLVRANESEDIRSYIGALRRIITLMEQLKVTSQETAENTRAIKEKLGAK